jgi:hypothetical protein
MTSLSVINDTTYPDLKKVQQGAQAEIEKVKQHKGNGSLVVMHMRYSSKANKEQNPLVSLDGTRDFLIKKGYKVWFIFADSRKKGSFAEIKENRSNVFPYPHPTQKYTSSNPGKLNGTTDYGKFYHLHILLGLIDVDNVKFVGNTSGTLDVAALMGYQVYNLHNLAESINYQTARILIQSAFLAVDCVKYQITPSLKGDSSPKTKENYDTLVAWLTNNVHPTNTHVEDPTPHRSKAGYRELYYVQSLLDEEDELLPFI